MNRIITVGREFGSGGREVGKRLAEQLQIAYYDAEIIQEIVKRTNLAEEYVHTILEQKPIAQYYPITVGHTLHAGMTNVLQTQYNTVFAKLSETIRDMADASDCVIVGRCADYILREKKPLRLFFYADIESRMARCREKAPEDEQLSDRELKKKILQIDRGRSKYYRNYTGQVWGNPKYYDICINTSWLDCKEVANALVTLIRPAGEPS